MKKKTKKRILISIVLVIFLISSFIPFALTLMTPPQDTIETEESNTIELTPEMMEQLNQGNEVEGIEVIEEAGNDEQIEESEGEASDQGLGNSEDDIDNQPVIPSEVEESLQ